MMMIEVDEVLEVGLRCGLSVVVVPLKDKGKGASK